MVKNYAAKTEGDWLLDASMIQTPKTQDTTFPITVIGVHLKGHYEVLEKKFKLRILIFT